VRKNDPLLIRCVIPRPIAFPLLKLDFTRNGPGQERFADRWKPQRIYGRRQGDDPRFYVPPRLATTKPQAFPAHIALVGFGRRCFWNRHKQKNARYHGIGRDGYSIKIAQFVTNPKLMA
jgi:hypothetical protein